MNTLGKIAAKYVQLQKYYLDYQEQGNYEMAQMFYNRTREISSIMNIIDERREFWEEVDKIRKKA